MKYRVPFLIPAILLLAACTPPEEPGDDGIVTDSDIDQGEEVTFPDPAFEGCVRTYLMKEEGEPIYASELASYSTWGCVSAGVVDITGIEYMVNLVSLNLYSNQIVSLEPLRNLKKVRELDLHDNQIEDIEPLASMTTLETLNVGSNKISSLSALKDLVNLSGLTVMTNQLNELSGIEELVNMKNLWISQNNIAEISIVYKMTMLEGFNMRDNHIQSIEVIKNFLLLDNLWMDNNCVADFSPIEYLKTNGVLTNVTGDTAEEQQNCTLVSEMPVSM